MTLILGLNAFHADAAAVLVRDGRVICAAEEERFTRVKHSAGFPSQAISWCLADANITLESVDHIAINSSPSAHRFRKIFYTLLNRPSPGFPGIVGLISGNVEIFLANLRLPFLIKT